MALARLIRAVTGVVVVIIVAGILLWVLSANEHNSVVKDVHDAAQWLVGPFKNVFSIKGAKAHVGVNWGLAAVVYLIVGGLIARVIARGAIRARGVGRVGPAV